MNEDNNIHKGHRKRLLDKLEIYSQSFSDYQLLEALLFYALPRVDTNPLAHKLLSVFGDLNTMFNASFAELTSVKGVGKSTADLILAIGEITRRAKAEKPKIFLFNTEKIKEFAKAEFDGLSTERCFLAILDKKYKLLGKFAYESDKADTVEMDLNEIMSTMAAFKPAFAIMGHNHISGAIEPSAEDDSATAKISLLCSMHGVNLIEHVIYSKGEFYSYRDGQRLNAIKEKTNVENIINKM